MRWKWIHLKPIWLWTDSYRRHFSLHLYPHTYIDFLCHVTRSSSTKCHFFGFYGLIVTSISPRFYVLVKVQTINESSSVLSCTQMSNYFFPFFLIPPKKSCMCQFDCWFNTMNNVCIVAQAKWTVEEMTILAKHCQRREINAGKAERSYGWKSIGGLWHNNSKWGGKSGNREKQTNKRRKKKTNKNNKIGMTCITIDQSKRASKWITLNVRRYKILTKSFFLDLVSDLFLFVCDLFSQLYFLSWCYLLIFHSVTTTTT